LFRFVVVIVFNPFLFFPFFFFPNKNKFFCCFLHFAITSISKYLQQVFSLESLERTWLKESQFSEVGYYRVRSYWVSIWVFAWDYWGGVWGCLWSRQLALQWAKFF
jgi:hypothetical protein